MNTKTDGVHEAMLKEMDADGNGLLSAEELRVGLQPYVPKVELGVDVMNDIIAFHHYSFYHLFYENLVK